MIFRGVGGGRFELIEFWQQGCGAAPQFGVGLRRRNNELNELTNCRAARGRRIRINRIFCGSVHTGGPARAESPTSPEPRATPWVNVRTAPAPCKGKSNKQPFAHTFALTGRRALYPGTQGVALGWELAALSGRSRRNSSLFPSAATKFVNSCNSLLRRLRPQIYFAVNYPFPS